MALFGGNRSVAVNLSANVNDYVAKMRVAQKATQDFGRAAGVSAKTHKADWEKVGKGMLVAGGAIGAGLALAAKKSMEFEASMSAVSAATGATGRNLDALKQAAIDAGAKTQYSATQAAEGITAMAKAGVDAKDILGGGLTGALNLAAAGQISVGDAAEVAATAMTQFGLSGRELPHVADLLAAGAGKAQGGVMDLANALKYVGPVSKGMGVSIEQTTGVLAEFASQGIIGEQAGTGLRGVMLSLTAPSKAASTAMDNLGINIYNAKGHFIGLDGAAKQLHDKLGPLDEATRNQALGQIFGNEQITAARILYAGGAQAVDAWTKKVNDTGFATRQAARLTDNLKGDIERLGGSLDTALIQGGSTATGALRGLTQGATAAVNAFSDLPKGAQSAAIGVAGVGSAALAVGGVVVSVVPQIAETVTVLKTLGVTAARASVAMKGLGVAAAVVGVAAAGVELGQYVGQAQVAKVGTDQLAASLSGLATGGQLSGAGLHLFDTGLGPLSNKVETTGEALKVFGINAYNALDQGWDARLGRMQSFGTATSQFNAQVSQLDASLAAMVQAGNADQAKAAFDRLTAAAVKQGVPVAEVQRQFVKYQTALDTTKAAAIDAAKHLQDLSNGFTTVQDASGKVVVVAQSTADAMRLIGSGAKATDKDVIDLAKALDEFQKAVGDSFDSATGVIGNFKEDTKKGAASIADQLRSAYSDSISSARDFVKNIRKVTAAGLDPALVADLLKQGPKAAAPVLEALVSDNSGRLIRMANRSQSTLRKIQGQVVEQARLTDLAMRSNTDHMTSDLGNAMRIAAAKAKSGGRATASALSHELGIAAKDVNRISGEFGISIAHNTATGTKKASGSVGDFYRVVRGGPVKHDVDFNTPGLKPADTSTGAYFRRVQGGPTKHPITFTTPGLDTATSKVNTLRQAILDIPRSRSVSIAVATGIANKVASQNTQLTKRAFGGYISGPGGPTEDAIPAYLSNGEYVVRAASVAKYGTEMLDMLNAGRFANGGQVGEGTKVVVRASADLNDALSPVVQALRQATDAVRASVAATAGGGAGGIAGTGGNAMGWAKQWAIIHGAFPGAHLNSAFRPGAITATGNRSYHSMGRAIDVTPSMAIFNWIRSHYGKSTKELIFSPANGRQLHNGQPHMYTGITRAMHFNHVHWAMANGGPVGPAAVHRRPAPRRLAAGGPVTGGDYSSIAAIVSARQTVTAQDRSDRAAALRKAQADLTAATKALTVGRRKDVKAEADARGSVRTARAGLADARRSHSHSRIVAATERLAAAERRLAAARRDPNTDRAEVNLTKRREALAKATDALHSTDRALRAQSRPLSVRYAEAAYTRNRVTGTFLRNLRTLADRGFGDLARQLTEMGGADAETLAAQAVRSTATARKLQTDFTVSARLQGQLAGAPAELAIRSALRTMKNPSLAGIAAATGLSTSDLQASLQAISGTLRGNGNAKTLLAGIRSQGFYSNGSFGSTTAAAGPTFHITVHNPTGDPYRAGEKAAQGVQRVLAVQGAW